MTSCVLALAVVVVCGPTPAPAVPGWTIAGPVVAVAPPAPVPADRWIAEDKARHFAMSFAATGMAYAAGRTALDPEPARSAAVGAAALLGVAKELMDVRGGGPFSLKDLAWDAAGVALGYTFVLHIR